MLVQNSRPRARNGNGQRNDLGHRIRRRWLSALAPPREITVSEWAAQNRVLTPGETNEPGKWRNERTPYLVGVMDAFSDPRVEEIVACFAAQVGKTEAVLNCIGYVVDQDPGTVLIIYPSERTADKTVKGRIHPMLQASPVLQVRLPAASDDLGLKEMRLKNLTIYSAWANSPSALASTPVRYVFADEVDKYPPFSGKEANPLKLADVRTRTYRHRRKKVFVSTPTTEYGNIWQAWLRSSQAEYHVPCPHCGLYQVLDFWAGLKGRWPEGASPEEVREKALAWYECAGCKGHILDQHKPEMLRRGRWAPKGVTVATDGTLEGVPLRTRRVGFRISALYSPMVEFGEIAQEFMDCRGDPGLLMGFVNSWLAEPWRERVQNIDEKRLRSRKKEYVQGEVPEGALVLTAGVDVQEDRFYFTVRAWGARERSWLIRFGVCPSWADVEAVLDTDYRTSSGTAMRVRRALVDSGYKTDEVYAWCRKHRPLAWPSKGENNPRLTMSLRLTRPEPGTTLYYFKADYWKDKLARFIATDDGEPGAWCLPADVDADYLQQMVAERRVILRQKGRLLSHWEPVTEHAANHYWDTEVLNVIGADAEGIKYLDDVIPREPRAPPPPVRAQGEKWLERGAAWLEREAMW